MSEEIAILERADTGSLYLAEKALIDSTIATAHTFPRNITRSANNALALVTMDKETAATCTYAVPRGGKAITGPSVHLAKIIIQCYGNIRVEAKVVDVDSKHVTSEAVCWDLENNVAIKAQVKRSIMTKNGRMSDDMITVTGNAANSIALRNAIFAVVPKALVDKCYNAALATITGDLSDETKLIAKRAKVIKGFLDSYGVEEDEVLAAVGKSSAQHLTAENIAVLVGIAQAIKDGDTTPAEAFKKLPKSDAKQARHKEMDHLRKSLATCKDKLDFDIIADSVKGDGEMERIVKEFQIPVKSK